MTQSNEPNPLDTIDAMIRTIYDDPAYDFDLDLLHMIDDPTHYNDDRFIHLANAIIALTHTQRCELLMRHEFCPIHACDPEICLDDAYDPNRPNDSKPDCYALNY